jgi:endonuclease/exonuclease/phosphatase (EEP) superfamily protein YafD
MKLPVVAALLVACQPPSSSSVSSAPGALDEASNAASRPVRCAPFTLASYNVNYGTATPRGADAETLAVLEKLDADVVLLQETNEDWEREITRAVGHVYPHRRFHDPGRYVAGGIATLSRHPILAEQLLPSPVDWFPAQHVVVDLPSGAAQILNLHLRPAISDGGSWVSGYFTTGHYRTKELERYLPALSPELPAIVGGDLNEEDRGGALGLLADRGLVNALPAVGSSATTWRWRAYGIDLAMRLDHVLYEEGALELVSAEVLESGRSDHLPVRATLRPRSCAR